MQRVSAFFATRFVHSLKLTKKDKMPTEQGNTKFYRHKKQHVLSYNPKYWNIKTKKELPKSGVLLKYSDRISSLSNTLLSYHLW